MKEFFKKLINTDLVANTGIYTIISTIGKAIPFFLLPIITRYLSPEEYGIVKMFTTGLGILVPFVGLNVNTALARNYFDVEDDNLPSYIVALLFVLSVGTFVTFLFVFFFRGPLGELLQIPKLFVILAVAVASANMVRTLLLTLYQVEKKPINYGYVSVTNTVLNMGISLLFIIGIGLTWKGRIFGIVIASFVTALASLFVFWHRGLLDLPEAKEKIINEAKSIMQFGVPLIPNALGGWALNMADRLILTSLVGLEATGLYSVGYAFGSIIKLLQTAFSRAWLPYFFPRVKNESRKADVRIVQITYLYTLGIIGLALAVGYLGPTLLKIFTAAEYNEAGIYVLWVALGYAVNGIYKMLVGYLLFLKRTTFISIITGVEVGVNVGLNFLLIPMFGPIGAAYATFGAFSIGVILVFVLSYYYHPMPWISPEVFQISDLFNLK